MQNIIADVIENFAEALGSVFKTNLPSFCDIETADTDQALVTKSGALVSGIRLEGVAFVVGPEEFESIVTRVTRALQSCLSTQGHTIDFFASRDAAAVRGKLNSLSTGISRSCERIGLEIGDIIAANESEIAKHTADESVYIAIWSRPILLTKREANDGAKELAEARKKVPPSGRNVQDPFSTIPALRERHEATVLSVYEDLKNSGIECAVLTAHEMLRVARMEIDPGFTPPDWQPLLLGDVLPGINSPAVLRREDSTELDYSDLQTPSVARQMFPRDAFRVDSKYVVVGDRAFAPVFVEIPPREILPFSALFEKLSAAQVPWRCMVRIDGGGLKYAGSKEAFASILSITSTVNRRIAESFKDLKTVETKGITNVRFRMSFCTWAPAKNIDLLVRRASRLAQTVSAWGQCEVREVSGDSMLGMMSSVPFITEACAANAGIAPLSHVVRMMPIMRPSSPWRSGSMLFRTLDGRVMPFQPGSSLQSSWNYIFFGRPGLGKSMQMLNLLLGTCMQPGISRLPRISIVDIGPSSSYFVGMIRNALPARDKHLAQSFKLKMSVEYAINIFDQPLGCRYPTPEHKSAIANILTQVVTPSEADKPYTRISELVSKVIDDIFAAYSDDGAKSNPKRYSPATESKVDTLLEKYTFPIDRTTAWWHVVDFLFSKGHIHEASLAQRYAVPTMSDCAALSPQVVDLFGQIRVESGETLTDAFMGLVSSALRDFPNLSTQTRFDIGEVRVASLNLEEVAKSGSKSANRQTAVMYMLATYVLTKDYRIDAETIENMRMPSAYIEHHMKRVRETKEEIKWIVFDEFHRTADSPSVQDTVLIDMREGRKFNIGVVLASQGASDFPDAMREFATGTFIVDAGSDKNALALQKFFGFNDSARALMSQFVNGPTSSGAPLLAHISLKTGNYTQILVSTLGKESRWALSTTTEDVMVREVVCDQLGAVAGRMALATSFPDGAKSAVERLRSKGVSDAVSVIAKDALDQALQRKTVKASMAV